MCFEGAHLQEAYEMLWVFFSNIFIYFSPAQLLLPVIIYQLLSALLF